MTMWMDWRLAEELVMVMEMMLAWDWSLEWVLLGPLD